MPCFADEQSEDQLLVFGCDKNYYPLSSISEDELVGFDIELIKRIAEYGGFKAEIRTEDWTTVLKLLQDEKIDAASGVIKTKSRLKYFDFSVPYLTEYYSAFVRTDSSFNTIEDLIGGVCVSLEGDAIIETFIIPNGFDDGLIQVSSFSEAFEIVGRGDADYLIAPYSMGLSLMKQFSMKELELYERSLMTVDYRFAVKKGSSHLFLINETLSTVAAEGIIDRLKNDAGFSSHFPVSSSPGRIRILHLILITATVLIIILFIYSVIRTRLKSRFQQFRDDNMMLRRVIETLPLGVSWQVPGKKREECNQSWLKYSGESENFQKNSSHYKIEHLPLAGDDSFSEGYVSTVECRSERTELSTKLEKISLDLVNREVEIERLRITDDITGLFNFSYLGSRVKEEIEHYNHYGQKFCIFSIEIEERCVENLAIIAEGIRSVLRRSDITGYNGNGIIIIILPKTNLSEAEELLKKIMSSQAKERLFSGSVIELPAESDSLLPSEIGELCR